MSPCQSKHGLSVQSHFFPFTKRQGDSSHNGISNISCCGDTATGMSAVRHRSHVMIKWEWGGLPIEIRQQNLINLVFFLLIFTLAFLRHCIFGIRLRMSEKKRRSPNWIITWFKNLIYSPLVFCHIRSYLPAHERHLCWCSFCNGNKQESKNENPNESPSSLKYAHIQFEMDAKLFIIFEWNNSSLVLFSWSNRRSENRIWTTATTRE